MVIEVWYLVLRDAMNIVRNTSNGIYRQPPGERGYRMPAEWERHKATWLTWPHDEAHWTHKFEKIPPIWARMVKELSAGEEVHILVHDAGVEAVARNEMERTGVEWERVTLHRVPSNFSWARDHGPIFVKNTKGQKLILHFRYNAWGGKWPHEKDEEIPAHVSRITGIEALKVPMVLEGGSIDVNGKGSVLTTESCLLHPNRNPHLTKGQIEERLRQYLGVTNVLWLGEGIAGDDTNGHVDDLARFVAPDTVVTIIEVNAADENYKALKENLSRLERMTDQDGNRLKIHALPLPAPVTFQGHRLPASYANFYIGNGVILLPVFGDPNDVMAVEVLQEAFPRRKIVPIDARDLVWGLGMFHCVTQQEPV